MRSSLTKAAGGVLAAKQAPTGPALGLRAGCVVDLIVSQANPQEGGFVMTHRTRLQVEVLALQNAFARLIPPNPVHVSPVLIGLADDSSVD